MNFFKESKFHLPITKRLCYGLLLCFTVLFQQCKPEDDFSAEASLENMEVEEGFKVSLAASEPLVTAPVAMTFDQTGRMWVVEMNGFMPDTLGTGEEASTGKIVILEDTDQDGVADKRKIFLDSLQLPRAICLIEDGALVAVPPYLWYYEIKNDQAGERTLVDSTYADEGNVEHQPNGLLRAMDNWIYNAKSSVRYRKVGKQWKKETTHFRGQWGLSQDNAGRLFYNHNSANVLGDYFTPGLGSQNPNQKEVAGYNVAVVPDNKVYPAHATTGVNRGYMEGVLDSNQKLVNFTAACGPLIYRGNLFGAAYAQNGFVAEPSANLVKRNILKQEDGYIVSGEQAYKEKEFLRSTDERFRPVNIHDGPDGALYVLDMYRGIIQHKTYLTPYLKGEIKKRNLTLPLVCGRIYRIVPEGSKPVMKKMPEDPQQLVAALGDGNGWIRDKAQQMLVDRQNKDVVPALQQALASANQLQAVHALWTLEGLNALRPAEVIAALQSNKWDLRMQGLSVIPSVIQKGNAKVFIEILNSQALIEDKRAAPYIGFLLQFIAPYNPQAKQALMQRLISLHANDKYVAAAIVSNLKDQESSFHQALIKNYPDTTLQINQELKKVALHKENELKNKDPKVIEARYPKGVMIYKSTCQTCHGADGNGIKSLAPPLNQSEWVVGNKDKLIPIILYGLTGPVPVNGHLYTKPEIMADMPGIGASAEFTDQDVAELLNYIRSSWQNQGRKISADEVTSIRKLYQGRDKAFTVEELSRIN